MTIDPDIEAMLAAAAPRRVTPIREVSVKDMRAGYRTRYNERSVIPSEPTSQHRIEIGKGADAFAVVIYKPLGSAKPLPLIIYFHGGGFVLGDAEAYERQSRNIALACNCAVAFVDYRKAPECPFPAAVDDSVAAARWLLASASKLGLDAKRVTLMGDSAGGNLAINVARYFGAENRDLFRLLCLLYPVTDFRPYFGMTAASASDEEFALGKGLDFDHMCYFGEQYLVDGALADDPSASPIVATDLDVLPDTVIFAARNDVLRDQGCALADRLSAQGVSVEYRCFDAMIHNFMGHSAVSIKAKEAFNDVIRLLNERLAVLHGACAEKVE
ncbi:alpha/beta hydrolase [Aquamicrobium sp. LC103]|uniref:alpha/beta hydrolase n=1 Tax=Aquamicrobium sp. LC103 TaxID=1120658 RepID=UPI000699B214|nr:alpha/beta hydrolase [Aquamicrobium sp. LC103]TKT69492.1 alpha/beta hydrolase [Aquamicrobium sp. LC103]